MSKYSNTIEYKLKTSADLKGIEQLQKSLTQVTTTLNQMHFDVGVDHESLDKSLAHIRTLQDALTKTFNPKLGVINGAALQKEIGNIGIDTLISDLNKAGASGQIAINNLVGGLGRVHTNLNTISSAVDKVVNTFGNTVRWGITASIFETMSNNLSRSVEFVRDLDTSLNNIQIVSGQSNEQMRSFAEWASQAGQNLGRSTIEIVDAAQIFAQNGFNVEDQKKLAELTNEVANVTQQSSETASSQITSLMNGYKLSIDEAKDALDAMALVAAESASDLNELATAETRVASVAHDLGVSQNQLTSQLSTMVSVTRQAPETVGNALRSIYARIGDLKLGETLEDGVNLGKVSGALKSVGIDILDVNGDMRDMGTIIEELMEKWDTLSRAQQQALSIQVAGKQQVNMFQTLMSNADMYRETLETAEGAIGTLDAQQEIYMDSAIAKMQSLSAAGEGLINSLFNADNYKPALDTLTNFVNILTNVVDSVGGGLPVLTAFTSLFLKLGNREIGSSIGEFIFNREQNKKGAASDRYNRDLLASLGATEVSNSGAYQFTQSSAGKNIADATAKNQQEYNELLEKTVQAENALHAAQNNRRVDLEELIEKETKNAQLKEKGIELILTENGQIRANSTGLKEYIEQLDELFDETNIGSDEVSKKMEILKSEILQNEKITEEWRLELAKLIEDFEVLEASGDDFENASKLREILSGFAELQVKNEYVDPIDLIQDYNDQAGGKQQGLRSQLGDAEILDAETIYNQQLEINKDFNAKLDFEDATRQVMTLVDGISSLIFVWQTFQSLGDIINDNTLSNAEKFDKIVGNLITSLPMLVMGIKDFVEGFGALKTLVTAFGATDLAKNVLITLSNHFEIFTEASLAAQAGAAGFGASLTALIPIVAAVVAGIVALIFIIKSIYDYIHRFDIALEEANENLKVARENTNKATSSLSELKAGLEKVKNANDAFNGLTKGTMEWTEALINANNKVLDLLKTYPELAKYITTDNKTGALTFTEEGMQEVIDQQMQRVVETQAIQAQAVLDQAIAENNKLLHNTNIGWTNSGITGYQYGAATYETTKHTLTDEQTETAANLLFNNADITAQELVNNNVVSSIDEANILLNSSKEALIDLGSKLAENTLAAQAESAARVQAALATNETYQELSKNEQEFVNQLVSQDFDKDSEIYQQITDEIGNQTAEQWEQMYREINNLDEDAEINLNEDQIKNAVISAGVIDAITQDKDMLASYIDESKIMSESLVSALGETGANAFNLNSRSFDFSGIKFTELMDYREMIDQDKVKEAINELRASGALDGFGEAIYDQIQTNFVNAIKNVDMSTIDMRLNGDLEDQIYALQDKMGNALEAIRTDAELTADDYRTFLDENLVESLDAVKITSDSVGSVYELLTENGIEAEKAIYSLNNALNDQQHALQMQDIEYLTEQYEELQTSIDKNIEGLAGIKEYSDLVLHLDDENYEKVYNDLMTLYDIAEDLENQSFSLSIDIGADLLDQANSIIDIMDDIVDATGAVGDEFVVAADKIDELAAAFPGILEGYSITADGMIQLNAAVVQDIMGLHSADAQSMAEAQRQKLNSYADYLETLANAYDEQAEMFTQYAEHEKEIETTVDETIAESKRALTNKAIELLSQQGLAQDEFAQAIIRSVDETNDQNSESFASGAESANKNLQQLANNGRINFRSMAEDAAQVAKAVAAAGRGDETAAQEAVTELKGNIQQTNPLQGNTYQKTSSTDTMRTSAERSMKEATEAIRLKQEQAAIQQESNTQRLLNEAQNNSARADALRTLASRLRAGAVQIEAKGIEVPQTLNQVGIPEEKEEKQKKEKTKTLKDYVDSPEMVTGSNLDMKEYLDDEADRYERINAILEKLANQFTRIANEQDRITGKEYAKNLGEQINLLKTQIQAQEKKLALQKEEAQQLQGSLSGYGVTFDSAGFILNNTETFNNLQSRYNSAIDAYNAAQVQAQNDYLTEINRVKQENNQKINEAIARYNSAAAGSDEEAALKDEVSRVQKAATSSEKAVENAYDNLQEYNKTYYGGLIDSAKDTFDTYKEQVSRYDKLVSEEIEQSQTAIEEFYNKIEDLQIEAYKKTVDMISNLKNMRETVLDINTLFSRLVSGETPLDRVNNSVAKLSNYWDAGTDSMLSYYEKEAQEAAKRAQDGSLTQSERDYYARRVGDINSIMNSIRSGDSMATGNKGWFNLQIEDMNKLMEQIDQFESTGTSSIFGENSAQLYEAVKTSLESSKKFLEDYINEYENLQNAFSDYLNEIYDKVDKQLDKFDALNEKLEHYQKLIEITYGNSRNYESLMVIYNNMITNNENQISMIKDVISNYEAMQKELNTETVDGLNKWNEIQEKILAKQKELYSATERQIETINEKLQLQNEKAIEDWERSILNGSTIAEYQDQWEIISRNAEQYLDAVESAYEIQKIQNKYRDLANSANTLTTQQRITDAMATQLEFLQGQTRLSQYQVDYANAQFEILQKTIALEEARNNKNRMRLQRDRQGNYSYVYTSNETDTNAAASELLDAQQSAYEISKNALISTQENILSVLQHSRTAILQIMNDTTLTLEERNEKIKFITEAMEEYINNESATFKLAQTNIVQDALATVSSITIQTTDEFDRVMEQLAEGNDEAFTQIDERWDASAFTWLETAENVKNANDELLRQSEESFAEWQESVDVTAGDVVDSMGEVTQAISDTVVETAALRDETAAFIEELNNDLGVVASYTQHINELSGQIGSMRDNLSIYSQRATELENKLAISESRNYNMEQQVTQQEENARRAATINQDIINSTSGGSSYDSIIASTGSVVGYDSIIATSNNSGSSTTINGYSFDDLVEGIAGNIWTTGSWGDDPTRHSYMIEKFGQGMGDAIYSAVQDLFYNGYGYNYDPVRWASEGYGAYDQFDVSRFDTGGYTGDWNDEQKGGRLAVLHQKELVLNPRDTENILQAVDFMRNIISQISSSAVNNMISNIRSTDNNQEINQNIQIEANFPNATSENEIKNAILNLTNNVAQYAHRKK